MLCQELMTREVECASPRETIESVAGRMRDANIGFLPVCDEDGHVIGTITERDIVVRLVANDMAARTPAGAVMTRDIVACHPEEDLEHAQELMRRAHVQCVLCVDGSGVLAGVIRLDDLERHDSPHAPGRARREALGSHGASRLRS
jgi:CBS domain-containing protein